MRKVWNGATGELVHTLAGHEPSLHTIEMVCDRLAELGYEDAAIEGMFAEGAAA